VKEARAQQLLRRLKSDARDLGAMAELMVRGGGRPPAVRSDALAVQAAWVAHRRRKVVARVALANQVIGELDLVFPGLDGCFNDVLGAKAGRVLIADICDPDRVRRQGVDGLRRFVARRGVALSGPKATQVVEAARAALRLPASERAALGRVLAADVALLNGLEAEIAAAEDALGEVLADTPAGILISLPGVAVVRASNYGAGVGDPGRFPNAAAAYRAAGLVPALYESAGRSRPGQHISREGSVELRQAIIELGRGLAQHEPDFVDYRHRLLDAGKPASVAAVAVGHRAHRLAFAMLRDQKPYDPARWATSVAAGRTAMAKTQRAHQNDVTCPPPGASLPEGGEAHNNSARRARG
jgi:transposase